MSSDDNPIADRPAPAPSEVSQSLLGPRIDVQILFDRYTHSYAQNEPPKITLRLISRAVLPITILIWRTPFDIKTALVTNGFLITNQGDGHRVKTTSIQIQRPALNRTRGGPDDKYFITLLPGEPIDLSAGFGYGPAGSKPQPHSAIKDGWVRDENGKQLKIRRSSDATGVDGLEPGHKYIVGLNFTGNCRWTPVSRDEVLVDDPSASDAGLSNYLWESKSLDFHVSEATLDILN